MGHIGRRGLRSLVLVLSVAIGVAGLAAPSPARAAPITLPLCALSSQATAELLDIQGHLAVGVVDLRSGDTWGGGDLTHSFTLHSTSKAVLAFAALNELSDDGEPLSPELSAVLEKMVVLGSNDAAKQTFDWLGGPPDLRDFYLRIGAEPLARTVHYRSWGLGHGRIDDLARLFARLAVSPAISEGARAEAYALLRTTWSAAYWYAQAAGSLPGWHSATKTGWFWLDDDSQRINHASIIFNPHERSRYSVVVMYEGFALFDDVWGAINDIHRLVARDIAQREDGRVYGDRGCRRIVEFYRTLAVVLPATTLPVWRDPTSDMLPEELKFEWRN